MMKPILAAAILAVTFAANPAHAGSGCLAKYESFWDKLSQYGEAKLSTETLVALNRKGLRAFDACQSGDEANFSGFWDKMSQYGEAKDSKTFWEEMSLYGEAKSQ